MVNPLDVHGKRIAMVAWGKKPDGTDDAVVFTGIANWDGTRLVMIRQPGPPFPVADDWLPRLKPVDPDLKETLLGADYSFSVTIGDLPEGADAKEYLKTGLVWPKDDDAS
jgi:hypothetical protein